MLTYEWAVYCVSYLQIYVNAHKEETLRNTPAPPRLADWVRAAQAGTNRSAILILEP